MIVTIVIDCFDNDDVFTHLDVIRETLLKKFDEDHDYVGQFDDNNCYGTHDVTVED